jgi:hypothetical protein
MKTTRTQKFTVVVLAGGLAFSSTTLFAQQRKPTPPVPFQDYSPSIQRRLTGPVNGVLSPGAVQIGQSYDGIDFLGASCSFLPPDTNAAVGNNFVVETVNCQIRIFDKNTGGHSARRAPRNVLWGVFRRRPLRGVR